MKYIFLVCFLLLFCSCSRNNSKVNVQSNDGGVNTFEEKTPLDSWDIKTIQQQKFISLRKGDDFILSDFFMIEPILYHRNTYTTTYRIIYQRNQFWVTVSNKRKIVTYCKVVK